MLVSSFFMQIAHDVAEGLAYMHPSVIHRDMKPQNILLDANGRVKIADFGISRVKVNHCLLCFTMHRPTATHSDPHGQSSGLCPELSQCCIPVDSG